MTTFSQDNGVGILITDVLGTYVGLYDPFPSTAIGPVVNGALKASSMWIERTWALNYPTFIQGTLNSDIFAAYATNSYQYGLLSQNVYNDMGEMLTITIFAPWASLPIVC